jgi:hypothetical protein
VQLGRLVDRHIAGEFQHLATYVPGLDLDCHLRLAIYVSLLHGKGQGLVELRHRQIFQNYLA